VNNSYISKRESDLQEFDLYKIMQQVVKNLLLIKNFCSLKFLVLVLCNLLNYKQKVIKDSASSSIIYWLKVTNKSTIS